MNENGWASRFRVYVRPLLRHTAKMAPAKRTTTTIPSTTYMRPGTLTFEGKGAAGAACASGKVTTPACACVPVPAEYRQAARSRPFRIERPHRAVMLQALIVLSNRQDAYLAASPSRTEVRNSGVARIAGPGSVDWPITSPDWQQRSTAESSRPVPPRERRLIRQSTNS
jgi:hypothetical protein